MIEDHAHRPGVAVDRRRAPVLAAALPHESQKAITRCLDLARVLGRAQLITHERSLEDGSPWQSRSLDVPGWVADLDSNRCDAAFTRLLPIRRRIDFVEPLAIRPTGRSC